MRILDREKVGYKTHFYEHEEGEVRLHKTSAAPEKRISTEVGDYVDFEETKE